MLRRLALIGSLALAVVVPAACSAQTSSDEVLGAPRSSTSELASTSTASVQVDPNDTSPTTVEPDASSTPTSNVPNEDIIQVRDGLLSTLGVDSPKVDHECRNVGQVDYCVARGLADVPAAAATCTRVNALPNAVSFDSLKFSTLDVGCSAVGAAPGACYYVQVLEDQDTSEGHLLLLAFAPGDWPDLVIALAPLTVPHEKGELDGACVPT